MPLPGGLTSRSVLVAGMHARRSEGGARTGVARPRSPVCRTARRCHRSPAGRRTALVRATGNRATGTTAERRGAGRTGTGRGTTGHRSGWPGSRLASHLPGGRRAPARGWTTAECWSARGWTSEGPAASGLRVARVAGRCGTGRTPAGLRVACDAGARRRTTRHGTCRSPSALLTARGAGAGGTTGHGTAGRASAGGRGSHGRTTGRGTPVVRGACGAGGRAARHRSPAGLRTARGAGARRGTARHRTTGSPAGGGVAGDVRSRSGTAGRRGGRPHRRTTGAARRRGAALTGDPRGATWFRRARDRAAGGCRSTLPEGSGRATRQSRRHRRPSAGGRWRSSRRRRAGRAAAAGSGSGRVDLPHRVAHGPVGVAGRLRGGPRFGTGVVRGRRGHLRRAAGGADGAVRVLHGDLAEHARAAAAGVDVQSARHRVADLVAAARDLAAQVLDRVGVHAGAATADATHRRGRRRGRRTAAVITAAVAVVR